MKIHLKAPAKINWFLSVLNKRDDGYHNIFSSMQCINLYDSLTIENSDSIELISDMDIPAQENLVYKAAVLLKEFASVNLGARIFLKKTIPHGAGLGGGSSDAAYTLMGLNKLWNTKISKNDLHMLALKIGSDVPFFIDSCLALVEGRGERITPLKTVSSIDLLIVKPDLEISTEWAYRNFCKKLTNKKIDIKLFCQSLDKRDFSLLSSLIFNDLELPVINKYPVIGEIKAGLYNSGALIASMSGSGSAVFGVFRSRETAEKASMKLKGLWSKVVKTI